MFESMTERLASVAEARLRVQQTVDALRGALTPFAELPLEAIRLHDSTATSPWSSKPCHLDLASIDVSAIQQQISRLAEEWQAWVGQLEELRSEFRTIPPEDVDDLLLQCPELRTDACLLDLTHREL